MANFIPISESAAFTQALVPSQGAILTEDPATGAKLLTNIWSDYFNSIMSYSKVTIWYDNTPMTDAKVDGIVYKKHQVTGEYFLANLQTTGKKLLKDTMAAMRAITYTELLLLQMGYYKEVELLGYYAKDDKDAVSYYWNAASTTADNGGNIIAVPLSATGRLVAVLDNQLSVLDFGAKGDGIQDDTTFIQTAVYAALQFTGKVVFPNKGAKYRITGPINVYSSYITLQGAYSEIGYDTYVDGAIFNLEGQLTPKKVAITNINIDGFKVHSLNRDNPDGTTDYFQTFVSATLAHQVHVSNCSIEGGYLGFNYSECYFPTIEKVLMQSTRQAFNFRNATNSFNIIGCNINGSGVPSYFNQNSTGGNISGCAFESRSGRLHFDYGNFGVNISGNYFEGYGSDVTFTNYIEIGIYGDTVGSGFNISGNLFLEGAQNAIQLNKTNGVSITGNYFATTHAVCLYTYDGCTQNDINYKGNAYAYAGSLPGASEFNSMGLPSKGNITSLEKVGTTYMEQDTYIPDITGAENILFVKDAKLSRKFFNPSTGSDIATVSNELVMWEGTTVAGETITRYFNVSQLGKAGKVYIVGDGSANYNEYMYVQSPSIYNLWFNKLVYADFTDIALSVDVSQMKITDYVGGRYLRVILRA